MALITLPTERIGGVDRPIPINGTSLQLSNPSKVTHIVPATDDQITVRRAQDRWHYKVTVGEFMTGTQVANEFELFMAQMFNQENFADFPLGLRAPSWTASTTISSVSGNTITLASMPAAMQVGDFIRIGHRLAKVESMARALRQITVLPRIGAVNETVTQGDAFRGRLRGTGAYEMPTQNGFVGPTTIDLIEVI